MKQTAVSVRSYTIIFISILLVSSLSILAFLVGMVYALAFLIGSILTSTTFSPLSIHIALSSMCVVGAIFLYGVKKSRYQSAYGLLEVAVGLVANWGSLDSWSHPVTDPRLLNILYARITILAIGIYLIERGIADVLDGFERLFPLQWPDVTSALISAFKRGYAAPTNIPVPKILLQRSEIARIKTILASQELDVSFQ
jgi:hypothetical protein